MEARVDLGIVYMNLNALAKAVCDNCEDPGTPNDAFGVTTWRLLQRAADAAGKRVNRNNGHLRQAMEQSK